MAARNPFEVLGLSASLVEELNDLQLQEVIKSQQRALMRVYHPDLKGYEVMAQEINEAVNLLDIRRDFEEYQLYKAEFLNLGKGSRKTSKGMGELRASLEKTRISFVDYLIHSNGVEIGEAEVELVDTAQGIAEGGVLGSNFYSFLKKEGVLYKKVSGLFKKCPEKKLIGCAIAPTDRTQWIGELLGRTQRFVSSSQRHMAYIGARGSARDQQKAYNAEEYRFVNRLHPQQFALIVDAISASLAPEGYLFAVNASPEGPYFSLEGRIIRILKASEQ